MLNLSRFNTVNYLDHSNFWTNICSGLGVSKNVNLQIKGGGEGERVRLVETLLWKRFGIILWTQCKNLSKHSLPLPRYC